MTRTHKIVLSILSVFVFMSSAVLGVHSTYVNSPDELVNQVFIAQFAVHHSLAVSPGVAGPLAEFVHPRSTFVSGGMILPVGFWGLIVLYGGVASVIGLGAVPFLTGVLTVGALWACYFLWRTIFGSTIAIQSAVLFALHPAVLYYSARGLFPNMPAFDLCAIGATIILLGPFRSKYHVSWVDDVLGTIILAIAALIRPVEALWWCAIALTVIIGYRKNFPWRRMCIWVAGGVVTIVIFVFVNRSLYGDAIGTYVSSASLPVAGWLGYVLPFGFHPRSILRHTYIYSIRLLWWMVIPAIAGIKLFFWQWGKGTQKSLSQMLYSISTIVVTIFVLMYYGSSTDTSAVQGTIGVSYVRYFIPALVLAIPFGPYLWSVVRQRLPSRAYGWVGRGCMAAAVALSIVTVLCGVDGLIAERGYADHASTFKSEVLDKTAENAILITDTEDKLVWPDRPVMVKSWHPDIATAAAKFLSSGRTVYFLSPTVSKAEDRARTNNDWAPYGIVLGPAVVEQAPHTLYRVELLP